MDASEQAAARPQPSVRSLLASWVRLSARIGRAAGDALRSHGERAADAIKDAILDLRFPFPGEPAGQPDPAAPLPAIDLDDLLGAAKADLLETFEGAVALLNEDLDGNCSEATEEQVLALFGELGRRTLRHALELQVSAVEESHRPSSNRCEEWARRYRRMLAEEGKWPPA